MPLPSIEEANRQNDDFQLNQNSEMVYTDLYLREIENPGHQILKGSLRSKTNSHESIPMRGRSYENSTAQMMAY